MFDILCKKEVNTGRQYNLDLLKAIAVVSMIVCHVVMRLSMHIEGHGDDGAYIFAAVILGAYVAVAHAFMFCMGVGVVYSKKNTPKDLFRRGVYLYLLAYILNFFRYSIYLIGEGLLVGTFRNELWESLYFQDILQFAGIAMMLTALFKKLELRPLQILLISAGMSVFGTMIAFTSTGVVFWDVLLGSFFTTTTAESHFALLNWYLFVALGMVFGEMIRRVQKLDRFYRYTMLISGVTMLLYIMLTKRFGFYFLSKRNFYYAVSLAEAVGFLSIDLFLASICYFMQKRVDKNKLAVLLNMSQNVTSIYVIHWCIIGCIDAILCYMVGLVFPYWLSYCLAVAITIGSYGLSMLWERRKYRGVYANSSKTRQ